MIKIIRKIYCLYNRPSFWEGMARLFDFGGILNQYKFDEETDFRAIQSDWQFVGNDIRKAMEEEFKLWDAASEYDYQKFEQSILQPRLIHW